MFSRSISVVFLRPIGNFIPCAASILRDNMPPWLGSSQIRQVGSPRWRCRVAVWSSPGQRRPVTPAASRFTTSQRARSRRLRRRVSGSAFLGPSPGTGKSRQQSPRPGRRRRRSTGDEPGGVFCATFSPRGTAGGSAVGEPFGPDQLGAERQGKARIVAGAKNPLSRDGSVGALTRAVVSARRQGFKSYANRAGDALPVV
jgi:hypothetical protein